jgi:TonB-linked SusC/RagA family outer membrane protein
MRKKCIILLYFLFAIVSVSAQTIIVKGLITDESGNPLPGAAIQLVAASHTGTISNNDGYYQLEALSTDTLRYSFVGYISQEIPVGDQTEINVALEPDIGELGEVVVVGYGVQKKENLTGSVSQVSSEDLADRPIVNLSESLSGLVPGLQISTSSGEIGASSSWNIHGPNTIGSGSSGGALILVDGVETNPDMINPNDIESISVLKDAASTAIYGSRAPYGVVLITTKSGKRSTKPQFTLSSIIQWRTAISDWDLLANGRQYAEFFNDLNINTFGIVDPGFGFPDTWFAEYDRRMDNPDLPKIEDGSYMINFLGMNCADAADYYPWIQGFANTDWFTELHRKNAPAQNYDFNVSGGTDKVSYYLSLGYQNRDGLRSHIVAENEKRYTMNARFDADITDWFNVGFQSLFANFERDLPMSSGFIYPGNLHPTIPVKDPNGNYLRGSLNELADGGRSKETVRNYTNTLSIALTPLKDLTIKGNYTWSNNDLNNETFAREYPFFYTSHGRPVVFGWQGQKDQVIRNEQSSTYQNFDLTVNYIKSIENHHFSLLLGMQAEEDYFLGIEAARGGMIIPVPSFNFAVDKTVDLTDEVSEWSTLGYFGRLNYNFSEKYLLEFNIREAASSRFAKDSRWGTFWGISAGWNIHKEDFFSIDRSLIGAWKLRTSYGVQGNSNVDRIYPMSTVQGSMRTYYFNGQRIPELPAPELVNSDLTWEKPQKLVLGTDIYMFDNRLNLTFDWYHLVTKDMVGPAPPKPDVLGAEMPRENNTELTTKGFDISFSWRHRIGDVGYNISLNLNRYSAEVTEYYNPDGTIDGINTGEVYYKGQKWGEIWGLTTDKIMSSPEDVAAYYTLNFDKVTTQYDMVREGSIAYKDINGDGKIDFGEWKLDDHGDWSVIGNTIPDLFYNFLISADWKGFDIRLFIDGQIGGDWDPGIESTYDWGNASTTHFFASGGFDMMLLTNDNYENYWREDRKDAYYFAPFDADHGGDWGQINARSQTRYLQDLTYLRIRNLQLGYNLPGGWIDRLKLSQFRVYASMENLHTFKRLRVGDPASPGLNYPLQRSISFGVNVQF